jgi:PAS domain S-box-containing protein
LTVSESDDQTVSEKAGRDALRIEAEVMGLDRSTDPFVSAVRATRMPMIITDPRQADNPVVFANDAFCRLTGYDREDIVGQNCRFLQGPETNSEDVRRIREAVDAVQLIETDIRNYRKDGSPFWNRLLMAPVFDANGALAYFFASQVDVTADRERLAGLQTDKAALEAELTARQRADHERDRELDLAMRAGGLGAWSVDVRTRTLVASEAYKTLMGWPAEAPFTYEDRQEMIHPDDRDAVLAQSEATIREGADYYITHRVITPLGDVRWMEARGILVVGADDRPVRIAGVTTDITERVRSQRLSSAMVELSDVLRDLEDPEDITYAAAEILGRTLDVSRAGFGIVDRDRETITIARDWNGPGAETLAGVRNFRDYGSYIEDLKRGVTVCFSDAREDPRTMETADKLEAIKARAVVNMPLKDQGGMVALVYLNHATARVWQEDEIRFLSDVGERTLAARERRRAERHLAKLAASLERTVEQRTAELMASEAALRQSQKMEAVGQLTGGIAHDFNNLLTGITGSLEMLAKRIAEGRVSETGRFIAAAQAAAQRATALTHRLLAFSRRQTLEPKGVAVEALARGMEDLIHQTIGPAIRFETNYHSGLWPILVDPGQLENALLNLCINARDAMPDGGTLVLEISNRVMAPALDADFNLTAGDYVRISVTDTGVGMTEEVMARAFDPFFTTKPLGQGTGLGLSMIYGFVRQSGGQVQINSRPGEGSVVALYLPRHHGVVEVGAGPEEYPAPTMSPHRRTILVVDDEATIRMLVSEGLSELGYDFLEAEDGRAGLEALNSDRPIDLLVTDVGLPGGMNGRQLADAARIGRPELKVLFITGYAETSVLSGVDLDPGMHILTKPFELKSLARRVQAILGDD